MPATLPPQFALRAAALCLLLTSCGGGGSDPEPAPAPVQLSLGVQTSEAGTVVDCGASRASDVRLTRTSGARVETLTIRCPSRAVLSGDFMPSVWEAAPLPLKTEGGRTVGSVNAVTMLPAPRLVPDGADLVVIRQRAIDALADNVRLERLGTSGATVPAARRIPQVDTDLASTTWRWSAQLDGVTYLSVEVSATSFSVTDTGVWGPVALSEPDAIGSRLFRNDRIPGLPEGQFTTDREFRDIRYVDLNGDGVQDVVSNVYGLGCVMIALSLPGGGYEVRTPLDNTGGCVGGHGETILVADFDGDGLIDIFLPSYERFHLLRNRGNGNFDDASVEAGITYPDYQPRVEGAAAVDIDFDGDVDIVVVNEVLLNDGSGHFAPMPMPFGPERLLDEGLSVSDVDADGHFDVVKHHPVFGPRLYWGDPAGGFADGGWMFGGEVVSDSANGIAVGDLTGSGLPDIVLPGGRAVPAPEGVKPGITGEGPRLCVQVERRSFECLLRTVDPVEGAWSDLMMVTDVDGDGQEELVARYGTLRIYTPTPRSDLHVYRFDLRNASGRRSDFGHSLEVRCVADNSVIATKFVDGGNGFMSQGEYVVTVHSDWCTEVKVIAGSRAGRLEIGRYAPGTYVLNRAALVRSATQGSRSS